MSATCQLCQKRRAKRHCPGLNAPTRGDICPVCCGNERENSIACPADCPHLIEARQHERPQAIPPESVPNRDVDVDEEFLRENEHVFLWIARGLMRAMETEKAIDADAREAIEAAIQNYKTAASGLIYESRPANPFAQKLQDAIKGAVEELSAEIGKSGIIQLQEAGLKDRDVMKILVFLQRLELQYNNGRRRGRAFFSLLNNMFREADARMAEAKSAEAAPQSGTP